MSTLAPQRWVAAQKAGLETTFHLLTSAFEGVEKLVELNLQAVKATLAESQEIATKALSAKESQELVALEASQVEPATEKMRSYGHHVYEIVSSTQSECAATTEAQLQRLYHEAQEFVDSIAKSAPAGSEGAVTAWKSVLTAASDAANATYEAAQNASKQALEIVESNVSPTSTAEPRLT
jgi:phasin family protein